MEIKQVDIKNLKPWEKNPRVNDHAVDTVAKSIQQFGFNVPILCDQDMAIRAFAQEHGIAQEDKAQLAGRVMMSLLRVRSC